jgi:hypothetical protein
MDDLTELAASVIAFAAAENLASHQHPWRDCGPEVSPGPEELDRRIPGAGGQAR